MSTTLVLVGGTSAAHAATACPTGANTWTGSAHDGLWGTPGNWSQDNAPGTGSSTEDVCLPDNATAYTVTLAPFQYVNNINNPPMAHFSANSLTVGSGATLVIHGASSNNNYSSSGGDATMLQLADGGSVAAGGTVELLATDDNDGGGPADNGGRGQLSGATVTNAGTFTSVSQTSQGSAQGHQNELAVPLVDLPGSTATVSTGTLRIDNANRVTNQGTWTVASGATVLAQYNGFNQSGQTATSFVNDGSYINTGTTVMNEADHGGVGDESSNPITWSQAGGSVTGNPIQFTDGAELNDAAGTGSFLFNDQEGQIAGTIPAGQTVTVEADAYGSGGYLNTVELDGSQVVNQGTLILHTPNVSSDNQTAIRVTGAQLTNQGLVESVTDVPNLDNELDVSVANAHGASVAVYSGTLQATGGQTVTNDGTIAIAPGAQLQEVANPYLTGKETFTNAADGTIAPRIASASNVGTVQLGGDSNANLAGTVAPTLVGGYVPAAGTSIAVFPYDGSGPTVTGTFGAVSGGFYADYSHETTSPAYVGLVYGTAPAATVPVGVSPGPAAAAAKPSTLSYGKLTVKGTTLALTLSCSSGTGCPQATVRASVRLREQGGKVIGLASGTAKSTKRIKVVTLVLATRSVKVGAGKRATVSLTLSATGRRLLAQFKRLSVPVTVSTGGTVRKTLSATVVQAKPKGHASS